MANYVNLPNTGLNLSLPIYLAIGLVLLIAGLIALSYNFVADKIRG